MRVRSRTDRRNREPPQRFRRRVLSLAAFFDRIEAFFIDGHHRFLFIFRGFEVTRNESSVVNIMAVNTGFDFRRADDPRQMNLSFFISVP